MVCSWANVAVQWPERNALLGRISTKDCRQLAAIVPANRQLFTTTESQHTQWAAEKIIVFFFFKFVLCVSEICYCKIRLCSPLHRKQKIIFYFQVENIDQENPSLIR